MDRPIEAGGLRSNAAKRRNRRRCRSGLPIQTSDSEWLTGHPSITTWSLTGCPLGHRRLESIGWLSCGHSIGKVSLGCIPHVQQLLFGPVPPLGSPAGKNSSAGISWVTVHHPALVTEITEGTSTRGQTPGKKKVGHALTHLARALSCRCFLDSASPRTLAT